MKHQLYRIVGILYMILSAPSVVFLANGSLGDLNPFYTLALGGIPIGVMIFLFGSGKFPINRISNASLKLAISSLFMNVPLLMSFMFVRAGYLWADAVAFSSMLLIVFLSLMTFIFIIIAVLKWHPKVYSLVREHH